MSGEAGGHFSHGAASNLSGVMANAVFYGVCRDTGRIDYDQVRTLALKHEPKLIVAGGASYPRAIDFARVARHRRRGRRTAPRRHRAFRRADRRRRTSPPVPLCRRHHHDDVQVTQGGAGDLILWNDAGLTEPLAKAAVPGVQGSPLLHAIAGKAVGLGEVLRPEFKEYGRAVLANARALSEELMRNGVDVLTAGTDTPLVVANLKRRRLFGQPLVESLDRAGITCNRCEIPFDEVDPTLTSGLRFGLSACTTRGLGVEQVQRVAGWIVEVVGASEERSSKIASLEARIRAQARELMAPLPLYAP